MIATQATAFNNNPVEYSILSLQLCTQLLSELRPWPPAQRQILWVTRSRTRNTSTCNTLRIEQHAVSLTFPHVQRAPNEHARLHSTPQTLIRSTSAIQTRTLQTDILVIINVQATHMVIQA